MGGDKRAVGSVESRVVRILALCYFVVLSVALVVTHQAAAQSYELSIYAATPPLFWLATLFGMVSGLGLLFCGVLFGFRLSRADYAMAAAMLLSGRAIFLLLGPIRGYAGWHGDFLSHLGFVNDLIQTGHLTLVGGLNTNPYPAMHIIIVALVDICSIPASLSLMLVAPIFSVLFVVAIFLVARDLKLGQGYSLLVLGIAAAFVFDDWDLRAVSMGLALMYAPLILHLYFKSSGNMKYTGLLITTLLVLPVLHALVAVYFILSLSAITLVKSVLSFRASSDTDGKGGGHTSNWAFAGILSCVTFLWVFASLNFVLSLRGFIQALTIGGQADPISEIVGKISLARIGSLEITTVFIFAYGKWMALLLLSTVAVIWLARSLRRDHNAPFSTNRALFDFGILFTAFTLIYIVYIVNLIPGSAQLAAGRVLRFSLMCTPLLAGYVIFRISRKTRGPGRKAVATLVAFAIAGSALASLAGAYSSPATFLPNLQLTYADLAGGQWYVTHASSAPYFISEPISRYADAVLGRSKTIQIGTLMGGGVIPHHFVFNATTVGQEPYQHVFLYIDDYQIDPYLEMWTSANLYNRTDITKLNLAVGVNEIYSNGGFQIYYSDNLRTSGLWSGD